MSELKRTQLYDVHVAAGATMVDFGGWEMPIQYPSGIIAEHLYTRQVCSLFDVSHMGRLLIEGPQRKEFLQHVLTSNVSALDLNMAQYCIIPNENGGAVDDAYLYLFQEDNYLLVVNAANIDKDLEHLNRALSGFDCTITNISDQWASIAVQGPKSKEMLMTLTGGVSPTKEPTKNSLGTVSLEGHQARIAKTGYTGEPLGYEVYVRSEDAVWLWNRLVELGARPAGLGARDTLRMEASFPLYGHEMGVAPDGTEIPIFAVPLAKFAVSFSAQKGDFIGRAALERQHRAFVRYMDRDFSDLSPLPRRIAPIALLDRGVMRAGMEIYKGDKLVGWVTSGTMVPYFKTQGQGLSTVILEASGKRAIGLCYIDSDVLVDDTVEVDIRGKRLKAVIPARHMSVGAPPFARPLLYGEQEEVRTVAGGDRTGKALTLLHKAIENHVWRQEQCVNLIPSENTPSRAVRLLSGSDPACRYAEHKKILAFYEKEVFYYQGTKFIDQVERMLTEEMRAYFGCTEVETRTLSGQMSNMAVFSALMDWKNRFDRKNEAKRLGYVMNNHIIKGGHLSAQPMGALHDYIAIDPVTEKPAVVNFPVCRDNPYKMDVEETKKLIDRYRPELIIFGKSMVLHKEPVAQIRQFVDEQKIPTTIMYDMAHVLGLIGDHFQNPFQEGAEIVTGSTHKTFFGPQRGVIGVNYKEEDLKYGLWKTIESRTFPGSVSNHHLGTQLGMLMAAYEMNQFRDAYQSAIIRNAKSFARSLKSYGLDVVGDPAIDYTETHQVIVSVGYGEGAEIAERLEQNNVIVNYQATPDEEGFTASGALRMGVSEMTRFGFEEKDFDQLASLMADCILRGREIKADVEQLRARHTEMRYCFDDAAINDALEQLAGKLDI
ncbi:glycine cleavage system aminomethyltransferase GcvT [Oscillospiraceae bacterium CLA-AA-H272]|uniref:Glycine cleavage system aminomethyltransferase GcvT n=1 Tax=Brotocaccenecus cirricatena TaxID=3064195 RepID=A0AAE3AC63_9FIRM|nr:glycine cleavage system aminomethyltransferase GcvT [Brotocaccenecus cirricatena]MCC2129429.1 glycine cleavage system aminomethyltransferase GcvT [Brotocaccenecus cirricatena]